MRHQLLSLLGLFVLVGMLGCSNHVGLSGKVVYSDNGEPVPLGEVQLYTPTFVARATIKPDGTFTVGPYKEKDGLPPGTYQVAILSVDENGGVFTPVADPKYSNIKTSGLSITIDKTTRDMEFVVDRPPK